MVKTERLSFSTKGDGDTLDITAQVARAVAGSGARNGVVALFVVGSTAGLTTIEYEPGAVADLARAFEGVAPRNAEYQHQLRWTVREAMCTECCVSPGAADCALTSTLESEELETPSCY